MFMTQPDLLFVWHYPILDPLMRKTQQKVKTTERRMDFLFHLYGKG